MNKERAIYFAGLMKEYLNIPSCVCENIENELINEKYNKVINYVIDRRKELENKSNYKTHQEIINMYLELQQENKKYKEVIDKAIEFIYAHSSMEPPYYEFREFYNASNLSELLDILKEVE